MPRVWNKHKQPFDSAHGKAVSLLKHKVFVAMSGGVDSSVTALLLKQQGCDVTGVFMKNWSATKDLKTDACNWTVDRRDALRVAVKLGIPLLTFDFQQEYRRLVVEPLFEGYRLGRTPNPDILCNKRVKFDLFLRKAKRLGADFIATGHYARVACDKKGIYHLSIPKDQHKDQTYFLYTLNQKQLKYVLFPLADLEKTEVRNIARKNALPTAEKKDSQGICFVGEVPIESFLKQKLREKRGHVLDTEGNVIGEHKGAHFYTVGQRHGFTVFQKSQKTPAFYVASKDMKKNAIIVVPKVSHPFLMKNEVFVKRVHWITGQAPKLPIQCKARIRHGQELQTALLRTCNGSHCEVVFRAPQRAVAAGQSLVLYGSSGEVLGGGVIIESKE